MTGKADPSHQSLSSGQMAEPAITQRGKWKTRVSAECVQTAQLMFPARLSLSSLAPEGSGEAAPAWGGNESTESLLQAGLQFLFWPRCCCSLPDKGR